MAGIVWERNMGAAIRWARQHRRLVIAATAIWFLAMLGFEQTRWNAIATLWGVLGVGLVLSFILEEQVEGIQRRVWLRMNASIVRPFLESLLFDASHIASVSGSLPGAVVTSLQAGATRNARRAAAATARDIANEFWQGNLTRTGNQNLSITQLRDIVAQRQTAIDNQLAQNGPLMGRLTELHGAVRGLDTLCDFLRHATPLEEPLDPDRQRFRRYILSMVARYGIDVCERCSDLLNEAGLLPE
jgi:hypothetical protein